MRVARYDDVILREIAGETFLVPIRGHLADLQDLFVLNEVGSWIWAHLDGTRTPSDLARALCEEFDVGLAEAEQDVAAFLVRLDEAGLLIASDPAANTPPGASSAAIES
jgi:hypothetical protein